MHISPPSITVKAGKSFGSGAHPTTQLALRALELLASGWNFSAILDMGCGSGILSLYAGQVWEGHILAVDINPAAPQTVRENLLHNALKATLDAQQSDGFRAGCVRAHAPYDLVICNILAEPIMAMAKDMQAHTQTGSIIILSGILRWLVSPVQEHYAQAGFSVIEQLEMGDWSCLICQRA